MTFDQWIDAVNVQVRSQLGARVRTEELSWDSATWVSPKGMAYAALADDGSTAKITFEAGERLAVPFRSPEAAPEVVGRTIAEHL